MLLLWYSKAIFAYMNLLRSTQCWQTKTMSLCFGWVGGESANGGAILAQAGSSPWPWTLRNIPCRGKLGLGALKNCFKYLGWWSTSWLGGGDIKKSERHLLLGSEITVHQGTNLLVNQAVVGAVAPIEVNWHEGIRGIFHGRDFWSLGSTSFVYLRRRCTWPLSCSGPSLAVLRSSGGVSWYWLTPVGRFAPNSSRDRLWSSCHKQWSFDAHGSYQYRVGVANGEKDPCSYIRDKRGRVHRHWPMAGNERRQQS